MHLSCHDIFLSFFYHSFVTCMLIAIFSNWDNSKIRKFRAHIIIGFIKITKSDHYSVIDKPVNGPWPGLLGRPRFRELLGPIDFGLRIHGPILESFCWSVRSIVSNFLVQFWSKSSLGQYIERQIGSDITNRCPFEPIFWFGLEI